MIKKNKHIQIVSSSNKRLSSMSEASRAGVLAVLSRHYTRVGITLVDTMADLEALVADAPDLVFLGASSINVGNSKVWLSNYLDERGIAYTGSGHKAHQLEMDKSLAKRRVLDAGLKTSPFAVAYQRRPLVDVPFAYPLFVKPTSRGGGVGINSKSVVHTFSELEAKVSSIATRLQSDSLIEKYLSGREFSVAILRQENTAEFSVMPVELLAPTDEYGQRILSGSVKSSDREKVLAVTDQDIRSKVCALALTVFHALGARDYGRIDIRLDQYGTPHFLEANLLPSLIQGYGSFPRAYRLTIKQSYEHMILHIVRLALSRSGNVEPTAQPLLKLSIG
ncbi:MAG TPA: D-alanine--D-alanine ligase [Verrucomicrobiae bacterium]|nr:D-alanine--D-alanine ligase [Verrucomicrobiae bacterium]